MADAVATVDPAAHFMPQGTDQAGGVDRCLQRRQVALGAATLVQGAGEGDAGTLAVILHAVQHVRPGAALGGGQQSQLVIDSDLRQRRFQMHPYALGFAVGTQGQQLEVGQQRIGFDQEGAGRVVAVVLEWRQIQRQTQIRCLQYQIPTHLAHPGGTQVAQQQPHALHGQLGVTAAAEYQITLQFAVADGAGTVQVGLPLVVGPEQLQRGIGGDQLHGRGRVDRVIGIDELRHALTFQRNDRQGEGISGNLGSGQRGGNTRGQGTAITLGQAGTTGQCDSKREQAVQGQFFQTQH